MNEIIAIITLILSGLAFVTYRHPVESRKLLGIICLIIFGILFLILTTTYIVQESYFNSISMVNQYFNNYKQPNFESPLTYYLPKSSNSTNQVDLIEKLNNDIQRIHSTQISEINKGLSDKMLENIRKISLVRNDLLLYLLYSFSITMCFFWLSYYFENIINKKNNNQNDEAK